MRSALFASFRYNSISSIGSAVLISTPCHDGLCRLGLYLHNFVFDGIDDKACGVLAAALFEDVGAVLIDCAF